jgi:flagellin-like hook-associated protein FlgL
VKNKSAVLEEMAKVRSETASMGGKKGASSSHTDIASIEAAAVKRGAEAASDEIKAALARAEAAEKNVNALTAQLDQVTTQGSATRTESGTASEGLDDEATRVRLARVLSALRGGDKGVDSSLWSWAFGSSEENEAATSRSTSAGVGGGVGTDGKVPPLDALLADFESAVSDDGNRVGAWSNETLEQARKVAADAISRAEKAEKALSSRDESTAAAAVTAAASQGAQAKRAAAAETLVQEVAAKLQASEKRCRDLEWQVSMLVDKSELGGGSGGVQSGGSNGTGGPGAVAGGDAPRGPGQWLQKAIKGCVAPRPGRGGG